jgi:hypothetical protein
MRAAGRAPSSAIATAPSTNDDASTRNAAPVPNAAIRRPPSAGPRNRNAIGLTVKSAEFACTSMSSGTSCGTIAPNAGPANACPMPKTTAMTATCHSSMAPETASRPAAPAARPRTTSATMITFFRSSRSDATPPNSTKTRIEAVWSAPTSPMAAGESVSS